jgi:hypothetical protein
VHLPFKEVVLGSSPSRLIFFTELVHRRPDTWREQDLPVAWELFEQVGEERMAAALRYCVSHRAYGGEYLRAWEQGLVLGSTPQGSIPGAVA